MALTSVVSSNSARTGAGISAAQLNERCFPRLQRLDLDADELAADVLGLKVTAGLASGDVGLPDVGEDGGEGWILGCAYAFGRIEPNVEVTVNLYGQIRRIQSNDAGWRFSAREAWD